MIYRSDLRKFKSRDLADRAWTEQFGEVITGELRISFKSRAIRSIPSASKRGLISLCRNVDKAGIFTLPSPRLRLLITEDK